MPRLRLEIYSKQTVASSSSRPPNPIYWSYLLTERKDRGASDLRALQSAILLTLCFVDFSVLAIRGSLLIDPQVGRMQTARLLCKFIWKLQRPQSEAAITTASLHLGG